MRRIRPILFVLACLIPAGCGDILGAESDGPNALWIGDTGIIMHPGEDFRAEARMQEEGSSGTRSGSSIEPARGARWWTDAPAVIEVDGQSGRVEALASGTATLWVELGEQRDSANVTVVDPQASISHPWRSVSTHASGTCALDLDGRAFCWGSDYSGELGTGGDRRQWTHTHRPVPVATPQRFEEIVTGLLYACARTAGGEVWCWGIHNGSRLGHGRTEVPYETRPVRVDFSGRATAITAGSMHTCLLDEDGRAHCWGSNLKYQLGTDRDVLSTADVGGRTLPVTFEGSFVRLSAGGYHTCGITPGRDLFCWGTVPVGSSLASAQIRTPEKIATPDEPVDVYAGNGNTCYLNAVGTVHCWGSNNLGQSGRPPDEGSSQPLPIEGDQHYQKLALSGGVTCGIQADGSASCWGGWTTLSPADATAQCGPAGDPRPCSGSPVRVPGDHRFRQLSVSEAMCGVTEKDQILCWNENDWGQLGIGRPELENVAEPGAVRDPG